MLDMLCCCWGRSKKEWECKLIINWFLFFFLFSFFFSRTSFYPPCFCKPPQPSPFVCWFSLIWCTEIHTYTHTCWVSSFNFPLCYMFVHRYIYGLMEWGGCYFVVEVKMSMACNCRMGWVFCVYEEFCK